MFPIEALRRLLWRVVNIAGVASQTPQSNPHASWRSIPRQLNILILICALALLGVGLWQCSPVDRSGLCTKLGELQETRTGTIEDQLNALTRAARNYRGNQAEAVRSEASKLSDIKGLLIKPATLDEATVAIRDVCGAPAFGRE